MPSFRIEPCPVHGALSTWLTRDKECILCGTLQDRDVSIKEIEQMEANIRSQIERYEAHIERLKAIQRHRIPHLKRNPPKRKPRRTIVATTRSGFGPLLVDMTDEEYEKYVGDRFDIGF